jgi:hypothetical protein
MTRLVLTMARTAPSVPLLAAQLLRAQVRAWSMGCCQLLCARPK